ncbi:MAG: RluA family pseudouridine synthase [Deltaproteobacteria bacterium]|jgi:23S rRNA pseudouridine955/2504/2580 synthase|nr:MAG: RluA family pseudouridine synthase [Deltaproteobacteria bacterium]
MQVMREIVLPDNEAIKKLESFLKKEFAIGYVRKLFRKNGVRVNGRRAKADDLIRGGDRIQLYIGFARQADSVQPFKAVAKLDIVYEDEALLVINKPAGIAVHEGKSVSKRDSVLGILETTYRHRGIKPQLVHRIDRDTSGLLLIAKNRHIAAELESCFETGAVEKKYLCLVVGRVPNNEGKIDFPVPGRQGNPVRALTRYRVVKKFADVTLVRVSIETGRLHQIRLHFAKLGHPVVMDDQHGDFGFNKRFHKEFGLKRQFLHAEKVKLNFAGKSREWQAPIATDLAQTLQLLDGEMG